MVESKSQFDSELKEWRYNISRNRNRRKSLKERKGCKRQYSTTCELAFLDLRKRGAAEGEQV